MGVDRGGDRGREPHLDQPRPGGGLGEPRLSMNFGGDEMNPPRASMDDDMMQGLPTLPAVLTTAIHDDDQGHYDDPYALDASQPHQFVPNHDGQTLSAAEAARRRLALRQV